MSTPVQLERPMPHSAETERVILGAILAGHKSRDVLVEQVRAADFFIVENQHIAAAIERLRSAGRPVDLLTVQEELHHAREIEKAGGIGYLAQLGDQMPAGLNLEHHLRSIKKLATLRA